VGQYNMQTADNWKDHPGIGLCRGVQEPNKIIDSNSENQVN